MSLGKDAALHGGLAEKAHKTVADFPRKLIDEGAKVESEHTSDRGMAEQIAADHLTEDLNYYTELRKMEKKSEVSFESLWYASRHVRL